MNIKQASERSGVPSQNIRFYESEGLVAPARRRSNGYRDYSEQDIRTLKLIRVLRMLEMPLPQIRRVLAGELTLEEAARAQQALLEQQAAQLAGAIRFCGELRQSGQSAQTLDVDRCLARMQDPQQAGGFFAGWAEDWRAVARAEHEKSFSFVPDEPVQDPHAFTAALLAYAEQNGLALEIEKESMNPRFLLDGVEYTAFCYYGGSRIPTAVIRCTVTHPEALDPPLPAARARWLRLAHYLLPPAAGLLGFAALFVLSRPGFFRSPDAWFILGVLLLLGACSAVRGFWLYYNENGRRGKK